MRLLLEYADHNETFSSSLPAVGAVEARLRSQDSKLPWYLVKLDTPLTHAGHEYRRLLIAPRWQGADIGDTQPVPVFTLLVAGTQVPKDGFSYKEFVHVAWCTASVAA